MPSGAALTVRWPEEDSRDPKTGALEVSLPEPVLKKGVPEHRPASREGKKPR
jgi:hypothetical protein